MSEGKDNRNLSFIQETVKQKRFYQNRIVQRLVWSAASGFLFALAALTVWAIAAPRIAVTEEKQEAQKFTLPEPEEPPVQEEEPPVYIMEQVSMELEDYKKMHQQLMQVGGQVEKSLVNVSAVTVDTDWFDETYTSQSDVSDSTREVILYADIGSSKTLRSGEPILAVGSPGGSYGSILYGNLTSVSQTAALYDGSYNVLTTDMVKARQGSGVLVNWSGKIIGMIQDRCEVSGQNNTIQAYGISDIMEVIEHLSNNQDIVYMGVVGADVTTAVSEMEGIPIGVYVSEVALESPAIEAGLQPGDIITSMSGQPVTNLKDVMAILMKCSNGQNIQVLCQRLNKTVYQELELSVDLKILE